jgi:hypothetical protein
MADLASRLLKIPPWIHQWARHSRARRGYDVFGLGRRRDDQRSVRYATADVAAATATDALTRYLCFVDSGLGEGVDERSLLIRLASEPMTWGNAMPGVLWSGARDATRAVGV